MPPPIKPEDAADQQPANNINWVEFRDTLLASQIAMQNSITALTQALLQNRLNDNPLPEVAAEPRQQEHRANSVAHRRAAAFEQQLRPTPWNQSSSRPRQLEPASSSTPSGPQDPTSGTKTETRLGFREEDNGVKRSTRNALRCFACGELGHRSTACPKQQKRTLLLDAPSANDGVYDSEEEEDTATGEDENLTYGDHGIALVSRRSCVAPPRHTDSWLRYNIFKLTCTINGRRGIQTGGRCLFATHSSD
ncbi:unnamed protein product [Arabidopsis thaliana]|uniref:(thale cress) hypothetical protein n=1 Tax=Arabidopsis thaliana TaxID=3702 RepID=A0A7G2FIJ3_ARATH|nr:unnamed protein product [Arabidopsis thaliana]